MPIVAECLDCGKQYQFGEDRAGTHVPCKQCGSMIRVPRPATRRAVRVPSARATRPAATGKSSRGLMIGGGIAGVALIVVVVAFLAGQGGAGVGAGRNSVAGASGAGVANGAAAGAAAKLSPEQQAQKNADYEASLEKQRAASSLSERDALVRQFGQDKVVTVVFTDVVGNTTDAHNYLNRKVFRASYKDYQAGQQRAQQQTQQNRTAAEQQAVADHKQMWGGFGPGFVSYRYQQVESDVSYPRIVNGGRIGNTFTYHAAPALNPQEFANRLGVGTIATVQGREIRVTSSLPNPIPDPDVEELVLAYGSDSVVHVHVVGAEGDPDRVKLYMQNETIALGTRDAKLSIVAMKAQGKGEYQFSVAPVRDPQVFAERIPWGQIDRVNAADRTIAILASIPANLPSRAELEEVRKKEDAKEEEIRKADREHRPRPGEAELDWVVRSLKDKDVWAVEKSLKALSYLEVDEERRDEISRLLIASLGDHSFNFKEHIQAMIRWKTPETERAILRLGGTHRSPDDNTVLMEALVELGTPECANALASGLTNFFSGDASVRYLIDMGEAAEEPVLLYLKHEDAKVRARVYTVLADIGTTRSATRIRSNVRLENDAVMKARAEECLEQIRLRIVPGTEKPEPEKPEPEKPDSEKPEPEKPETGKSER